MGKKNQNSLIFKIALLTSIVVLLIFSTASIAYIALMDRIYPGIYISHNHLFGLTPIQAKQKLETIYNNRLSKSLDFYYNNSKYSIDLNPESLIFDIDDSISKAYEYGHHTFYTPPIDIPINVEFSSSLKYRISQIAKEINQEPINSQIRIEGEQINVTNSQQGLVLDEDKLLSEIENYILFGNYNNKLSINTVSPKLSYQTALKIKNKLDQIKLSPLVLSFQDQTFNLTLSKLLELIDLENTQTSMLEGSFDSSNFVLSEVQIGDLNFQDTKLSVSTTQTDAYFKNLSLSIDQPVVEPLFEFDPNSNTQNKIKEFRPPQQGRKLDIAKSKELLASALDNPKQTNIILPVEIIEPKNKLTNELGIKELIGQGISNFSGSIPNRIFNVSHAASKINGLIIPPGEEFSFVNTVGDISAATGYKQAYVIKSGRTVLDDGGGVCQVSTTIFRAALNSGLPITERTAHAYRVGYYEQGFPPGLDATIFHPSVDFKFKNDSGKHILIQAYTQGTTLYVDLYGTKDGRNTTISKPVITNITPAPPELRQDDPTLPKGTVKQVDWAANGANVVFKRIVEKNGQLIINETFHSNYRPWQAVYLVGTGG